MLYTFLIHYVYVKILLNLIPIKKKDFKFIRTISFALKRLANKYFNISI